MTPIPSNIIYLQDLVAPTHRIDNHEVIAKVNKNSFMSWSNLLFDFDIILEMHITSILEMHMTYIYLKQKMTYDSDIT